MAKKEETRGRPKIWPEATTVVATYVPVSKREDFKQRVQKILKQYKKEFDGKANG